MEISFWNKTIDIPQSVWTTERASDGVITHKDEYGYIHPNAASAEYLAMEYGKPYDKSMEHYCNGRCKDMDFPGLPENSILWCWTHMYTDIHWDIFSRSLPVMAYHTRNLFASSFGFIPAREYDTSAHSLATHYVYLDSVQREFLRKFLFDFNNSCLALARKRVPLLHKKVDQTWEDPYAR